MTVENIAIRPDDPKNLTFLMDQYGDSTSPFFGENEDGERILIGIYRDHINVSTFQTNGWVRRNIYYYDGSSEELWDGRWN